MGVIWRHDVLLVLLLWTFTGCGVSAFDAAVPAANFSVPRSDVSSQATNGSKTNLTLRRVVNASRGKSDSVETETEVTETIAGFDKDAPPVPATNAGVENETKVFESPIIQALNFSTAPLVKREDRRAFLSKLARSKQARSMDGMRVAPQVPAWKRADDSNSLKTRVSFLPTPDWATLPVSTNAWYSAGCLLTNNLTKCGRPPSGRSGHSATRLGDRLIVFGGCYLDYGCFNDVFELNAVNMSWSKVLNEGEGPSARMGHTATKITTNAMVVFGGTSLDDIGTSNEVFVYNAQRRLWGKPSTTGSAPIARHEHTATLVGRKLFIHGGLTGDATILGDLHVLDTEFMLWFNDPPTSGQSPGRIHGHSSVLFEDRMVVFGGHTPKGTLDSVHILDTQTMQWHRPKITGSTPHARSGHAAIMMGVHMLVVGGCSYPDRNCYADTPILNVVTGDWTRLQSSGSTPSPREGHSITRLDQNRIVMIGGCRLDTGCYHDVLVLENTTNRCVRDCLKRGKCVRNATASVCKCNVGYSGLYCRKVVTCPNNCSNAGAAIRGVCLPSKKNAMFHGCRCLDGWGGLDCSKALAGTSNEKAGGKKGGGSAGGSGSSSSSVSQGSGSGSNGGKSSGQSSSSGKTSSSTNQSLNESSSQSSQLGSGSSAKNDSATSSGNESKTGNSESSNGGSAMGSGSSASASSNSVDSRGSQDGSSNMSSSASFASSSSSGSVESSGKAGTAVHQVIRGGHTKASLTNMFDRLKNALVDPEDETGSGSTDSVPSLASTSSGSGSGVADSDSGESGSDDLGKASGSNKCPNDCSRRGKCKDGQCFCTPGFTTDDCSQSVEEYEKGVDAGALVEKDMMLVFAGCFAAGCCAVVIMQVGSWMWKKASNRYKGIDDSDDSE